MYRVSIKSFLDYKHLIQEKYVEYKHIFLSLFKLVSKILCHLFVTSRRWLEILMSLGYEFSPK